MTNMTTDSNPAAQQFDTARKELSKLPLLGPVLWLYARDPQRKYSFIADLDWRLMPPLIHDQCHFYSKQEFPWAFFTWAFVSDEVDARLRSTNPVLAPHEWKSGTNPWLVDIVTPFGDPDGLLQQTIDRFAPGRVVRAWVTDTGGTTTLREFKGNG